MVVVVQRANEYIFRVVRGLRRGAASSKESDHRDEFLITHASMLA